MPLLCHIQLSACFLQITYRFHLLGQANQKFWKSETARKRGDGSRETIVLGRPGPIDRDMLAVSPRMRSLAGSIENGK